MTWANGSTRLFATTEMKAYGDDSVPSVPVPPPVPDGLRPVPDDLSTVCWVWELVSVVHLGGESVLCYWQGRDASWPRTCGGGGSSGEPFMYDRTMREGAAGW